MDEDDFLDVFDVAAQSVVGASLVVWDIAAPFWLELGLGEVDRAIVEPVRRALDAYRTQPRDNVDLDLDHRLQTELGEAWPPLDSWLEHDFVIDSHDQWGFGQWMWLVEAFASTPPPKHLAADDRALLRAAVAHLTAALDDTDLDNQLEGLRGEPFSDWDVLSFADLSLNPYAEVQSPFVLLRTNIMLHRFRRAARNVITGSDVDDLLLTYAQHASRAVDGNDDPLVSLAAVVDDYLDR